MFSPSLTKTWPPQTNNRLRCTHHRTHPKPAAVVSKARSAEFLLPPALSELVAGGMELGQADDKVWGVSWGWACGLGLGRCVVGVGVVAGGKSVGSESEEFALHPLASRPA